MSLGARPAARPRASIPPVDVPAKRKTLLRKPGRAVSMRSSNAAAKTPRMPPPSIERMRIGEDMSWTEVKDTANRRPLTRSRESCPAGMRSRRAKGRLAWRHACGSIGYRRDPSRTIGHRRDPSRPAGVIRRRNQQTPQNEHPENHPHLYPPCQSAPALGDGARLRFAASGLVIT